MLYAPWFSLFCISMYISLISPRKHDAIVSEEMKRKCGLEVGERRGDNAGTQALWDDLTEGKAFV